MSMDTRNSSDREGKPALRRGVKVDSNAHWHTQVAAPKAATTSINPSAWTKVLTLCLGVLLALTMLDTTTLSTLASDIGEASTPLAATANPMGEDGVPGAPNEEWPGPTGWADTLNAQKLEPSALTPARLASPAPALSATVSAPVESDSFDFEGAFARLTLMGVGLVAVVAGLSVVLLKRRKSEEPEQGETVGLTI